MKKAKPRGRIFAVGDIHGQLKLLDRLLAQLPLEPKEDLLVFLGDYVDRGPDPKGVLERLMFLDKSGFNTVFLKGNHEVMLLDYFSGRNRERFLFNGGYTTLQSYARPGQDPMEAELPPDHLEFINGLELYFETQDAIFVHAGLRPGIPLKDQDPEDLLWIRDEFFSSGYDWGKAVVFGHTPFGKPFRKDRLIGLDTGAAYGGGLTCLMLPDLEFFHV